MKLVLFFFFAALSFSFAHSAETTFEIVKIKPVELACNFEHGGGKNKKVSVKIQDCWMEAKDLATKKKYSLYLDIAKCQGKAGEKISLDVVEHTCATETPKLKCVLMGNNYVIDRLIDQSYETKICSSGQKSGWLEKSFANRSEVKY